MESPLISSAYHKSANLRGLTIFVIFSDLPASVAICGFTICGSVFCDFQILLNKTSAKQTCGLYFSQKILS